MSNDLDSLAGLFALTRITTLSALPSRYLITEPVLQGYMNATRPCKAEPFNELKKSGDK
ncbi:hypothetical protein VCRA2128O347_410008 [Vibrio crassostreae]|nr:hypothetical protein VCRA2119O381_920008 [Vibrio crassostreae]CAK3442281.1 hypothetical protein VCRA2120O329_380023 [Vibrio crassostreae]CAK3962340.1 hypothetical protein VCRA2128O347_410008 [Vibrio crassostreae]